RSFEVSDNMRVHTGGIISEIKKMFTKTGNKPMAILKIEDLLGSYDVMLFNKFYEQYKDQLVEDAIVTVDGRLSIRDGDSPIIILDKMEFVENEEQKDVKEEKKQKVVFNDQSSVVEKKKRLYMQFNIEDEGLKEQIFEVLQSYPGTTETYVQFNKKLYALNSNVNVKAGLMSELSVLVGENNIKVI
ncbi:MAG: hypothetical protein IJB16_01010, partial [Clostridia bacterium]|nr:hypothetical protein [Clostridia bacterium]